MSTPDTDQCTKPQPLAAPLEDLIRGCAFGEAVCTALSRCYPADFDVTERLDIEFDGQGEHLVMCVEKSLLTTHQLLGLLAEIYNVRSVDVGYCGLKDKIAVTRQWFSIRTTLDESVLHERLAEVGKRLLDGGGQLSLVRASRHGRKLRIGSHQGNRFVLRLRDVAVCGESTSLVEDVAHRLNTLAQVGYPNFFGAQRFGFAGRNVEQALGWYRQASQSVKKRSRRTSRHQRSMWLSAVRAAIFNRVCAERIADGTWQQPLPGEALMLAGSQSLVALHAERTPEEIADLERRCDELDVHPTGPLGGQGRSMLSAAHESREAGWLAGCEEWQALLAFNKVSQARRSLRAVPIDLTHRWLDSTTLELNFELPPGSYATSLLMQFADVTSHSDGAST